VLTRRVKNQRLASAGYQWAFNTLAASPGAKAHYQRRREHGDWHNAALRHLFNRQLGILHHCLTTRQTYNETKAFPQPQRDQGHSRSPLQVDHLGTGVLAPIGQDLRQHVAEPHD